MTMDEDLELFIYQQVDSPSVFTCNAAYCMLGEEKHYFHVWAAISDDEDLLIGQFKRDITAWVKAGGSQPTIVVRAWPEIEPVFEGGWQLRCRMLVVNRFYKDVPPSFMPKAEGKDAQVIGGTDG